MGYGLAGPGPPSRAQRKRLRDSACLIDDPDEPDRRPFLYIGLALGEQDRLLGK
jgi:hypothetical protein